ncbi:MULTISPECIES: hypothetical protein [unclassified Leisingera]|uniref:hypothetical protein n=1 Tax=unclassified Leisingera TaxID=2614906 RepID=UPI0002D6DDF4|nr:MULTISPECIES: hypothetical protein [unclassified Leisingera]KIC23332.1 hypothetical protein RA23_14720 [Leisingera sp. ANG-S3]KIC54835.1 hypothetical protein RA22_03405 [Leisingera sp. ANG-S]KID08532.1 hypothetical protein GC1_15430 [Leisingera sp. ANG1]
MKLEALITSVVMIGHSLFGPDNPQMLEQLLDTQAEARVEAQIINGAPLSYNWQHSGSAEGVDSRERLKAPADAVIVTEAIPLANHLKWSGTEQAVTQFYELVRTANPEVQFYLQETWHSLDSGTGADVPFDDGADVPWRVRLDQDLPRWQAVVEDVNAATGGTVKLLPAGQAMARLDDAIRAGTMPGLSSIRDVFADDIHPNATGFYFMALLQYAVLTGEDPAGLPHQLKDRWGKPYRAPSPELAARLQQIAWAAAQGDGVRTAALPADPAPLPQDPPEPVLNAAVLEDTVAPARTASRQPIAVNLAGIADWSTQAPFLDHFKTARPWIGHLPRRWGGADHGDLLAAGYLDPAGWPTAIPPELSSIGTVILTDMPEEAVSLAGRYVLRFEGEGIVEVLGRAENVRYGKGEVRFDFTPGPGPVEIRIQRMGRDGGYVRNITVVKEEHLEAFDRGAVFNPLWLDHLDGFAALRFMDWMATNDSQQTGWEDRPLRSDYTWAQKGVPVEVMLELANTLGADPWFSMPHMADDTYVRQFAQLVERGLDEDLRAYVEYSNEVWNWQFQQAAWADAQAKTRWGGDGLWMQFYGGRAAEVAQIWTGAFGEDSPRLVRVISSQAGWLGLEEQVLAAPLWKAEQAGRRAPAAYFDAYAVTGYFGGVLGLKERAAQVRAWIAGSREQAQAVAAGRGLSGAAAEEFTEQHRYDAASAQAGAELRDGLISGDPADTLTDLLGRVLPYHAEVAQQHGLELIMYEGGSHVVGIGPMVEDAALTSFFTHFNYTPEMGALYQELLAGWQALGGSLFTAYSDVGAPGKWGSWGALRTLSDQNPRWDALEAVK